jgi:hypothetical protein
LENRFAIKGLWKAMRGYFSQKSLSRMKMPILSNTDIKEVLHP